MADYSELKSLLEGCRESNCADADDFGRRIGDLYDYLDPETVAEIVAETERLVALNNLHDMEMSGVERAKQDLAEILDCADEPRWKWLYCNASSLKAERDQLKAEAEALRAELAWSENDSRDQSAQIESLRKDAERYRYLRSGAYCVATIDGYRVICEEPMPGPFVDADAALDSAIDAAINKEAGQ